MMESLVIEIAKQVPALVVLAFIVQKFLSSINEIDRARQAIDEKKAAALERLGDNCHTFQERLGDATRKVIDRNSDTLSRNTEALGRIETIIDDIDRKMNEST